jgi:hypothetical protein
VVGVLAGGGASVVGVLAGGAWVVVGAGARVGFVTGNAGGKVGVTVITVEDVRSPPASEQKVNKSTIYG